MALTETLSLFVHQAIGRSAQLHSRLSQSANVGAADLLAVAGHPKLAKQRLRRTQGFFGGVLGRLGFESPLPRNRIDVHSNFERFTR